MSWISELNIKACPHARGHVDLVPWHINYCGYVPDWASDFLIWACTYFPNSIHKLYRACISIGWAHENFSQACKFLKPLARRACKPNAKCQALNSYSNSPSFWDWEHNWHVFIIRNSPSFWDWEHNWHVFIIRNSPSFWDWEHNWHVFIIRNSPSFWDWEHNWHVFIIRNSPHFKTENTTDMSLSLGMLPKCLKRSWKNI